MVIFIATSNCQGLSVGVKIKDKGKLLFGLGLKNISGLRNNWFWNALNTDWLSTPWETCPICLLTDLFLHPGCPTKTAIDSKQKGKKEHV